MPGFKKRTEAPREKREGKQSHCLIQQSVGLLIVERLFPKSLLISLTLFSLGGGRGGRNRGGRGGGGRGRVQGGTHNNYVPDNVVTVSQGGQVEDEGQVVFKEDGIVEDCMRVIVEDKVEDGMEVTMVTIVDMVAIEGEIMEDTDNPLSLLYIVCIKTNFLKTTVIYHEKRPLHNNNLNKK